jgi:F-type H+-transporting ATPase subunit delta
LSGLASRYAIALFELADEAKQLDRVADDLKALRALMAESADLRQLVRSPVLGRREQSETMQAIMKSAGAADLTRRFVAVVASNKRLFVLGQMIGAYLAELARRRGEMTAEVTAAQPLTEEQKNALTDQIKKAVGAKVSINLAVDPSLLGGMVVKIGSRMIDTSIKTKLNRLQLAMKGVA